MFYLYGAQIRQMLRLRISFYAKTAAAEAAKAAKAAKDAMAKAKAAKHAAIEESRAAMKASRGCLGPSAPAEVLLDAGGENPLLRFFTGNQGNASPVRGRLDMRK